MPEAPYTIFPAEFFRYAPRISSKVYDAQIVFLETLCRIARHL